MGRSGSMAPKGLSFEQMIYLALITAVVTLIGNALFHTLKNRFDWFKDTKEFKRKYYYEQLKELYIPLYSIVVQSEYLRRFHHLDHLSHDQVPFLEINKKKTKVTQDLLTNEIKKEETEKLSDVITEFNKEKIAKLIIDNGMFASQKLLKLAVSYRYVHKHYTDKTIVPAQLESFQKHELFLINEIVKCIVKECNEKLKECSMPYSEEEIELSRILIDYPDKIANSQQEEDTEESTNN